MLDCRSGGVWIKINGNNLSEFYYLLEIFIWFILSDNGVKKFWSPLKFF